MSTIESPIKPEFTFEEFCKIPFEYLQGIRMANKAIRVYGNTTYGIYRQTNTPFRESTHTWGKPRSVFYMHPNGESYDTGDQLYVAYMREVCGVEEDTTDNERNSC